jgi:flagellum-specific peptidoglycan hydrolase FlgJ
LAPRGSRHVYARADDAYVAAPSKKAALAAWGTDKDLFARGAAEVVEDPALTADALAAPGTVIRRTRGSLAEQLAAAGPAPRAAADAEPKPRAAKPAKPPKPKPRPSRDQLDAAEAALDAARARADEEQKALRREEEAMRQRRADLEREQQDTLARLDDAADRARRKYEDAMERWRADG